MVSTAESQPEADFPRPYGRFELLERIGEGGMAEVFRARLPGVAGFEKILVIKRILPHLARNKRFVQMFVNEAQLAARLQHQNIVQVYELGQLETGELYIAMEYVPGIDLRGILRNAAQRVLRIPIWFSVHTVAEIAGGLSHAHELVDDSGQPLQVVHRDVTPSNIFVSKQGEVKLADFGIAKAQGQVSETRSGQLKGKISYMPPEQLHGQPLDGRADVFAVGVVLWECLTQRRLFGGRPDFETMLAICEHKREPPSRFNPKVPPDLDALTLMSLEPDRERRVNSAREFQARLLEILSKLRPRLLPSEVKHVVDVMLGTKEPDPKRGADLPYESSTPGNDGSRETRTHEAPPIPPPIRPDTHSDTGFRNQPTPSYDAYAAAMPGRPPQYAMPPLDAGPRHPLDLGGYPPPTPPPVTWQPPGSVRPDATKATEFGSMPRPPGEVAHPLDLGGPGLPYPPGFPMTYAPPPQMPDPNLGPGLPPHLAGTMPPRFSPLHPPLPPIGSSGPLSLEGPLGEPLGEPVAPPARPSTGANSAPPGRARALEFEFGDQGSLHVLDDAVPMDSEWSSSNPGYSGSHPFFLKMSSGRVDGPLGYDELLKEVDPYESKYVEISGDQKNWMDITQFARLSGLDFLALDRSPMSNVVMVAKLDQRSLVSILCRIARAQKTGRLVIMEAGSGKGVARRDIDIVQGAPTFVWAEHRSLQLPALLVRREIVAQHLVPEIVHGVLTKGESIEDLVSRKAAMNLSRHRPLFMRDRLADVFSWRQGKVAFDEGAPPRVPKPFAPSLFHVLVEGVQRGWGREELKNKLAPKMARPFERSERFEDMLAQMDLTEAQSGAARKLIEGRSLAQQLKKYPNEQHMMLIMAYVLLEMDVLLTPLG